MAFVLPVGIDFADGVTLLPGQPTGSFSTPTIIGTPLPTAPPELYIYSNTAAKIEEEPGSPSIEKAEQCTCRHKLKMPYVQGLSFWTQMDRGTIVTDSSANVWRVLSVDVTRTEGTFCDFSYVMESISFDSPPDDFSVDEVSLDLNIIKHPRYAWALNPYVTDASTYYLAGNTRIYYSEIKEAIIRMIQNYIDSPFYPSDAQTQGLIQTNILSMLGFTANGQTAQFQIHYPNSAYNASKPTDDPVSWDGVTGDLPTANCVFFLIGVTVNLSNPTDPITIALAAAKELLGKLWRNEDTPYIAGYKVRWKQYFFAPVYINCGGYIEDCRWVVPQYFMSPFNNGVIPRGRQDNPYGGDLAPSVPFGSATIFDQLPNINPQCYSVNGQFGGPLSFSSLRTSDTVDYQRTWFGYEHNWLVAPVGKWDSDLYTSGDRPMTANDFNRLPSF